MASGARTRPHALRRTPTSATRSTFQTRRCFCSRAWCTRSKACPLVFRTWRCTGREQQKGEFITMVPDRAVLEMNGITEAIVVDLAHVGKLDGSSAHYKVLDAGSLEGLQEVKDLRRKRRRLTKHSDISDEQRVRLGTSYASVPLSSTMVTLGPDASI